MNSNAAYFHYKIADLIESNPSSNAAVVSVCILMVFIVSTVREAVPYIFEGSESYAIMYFSSPVSTCLSVHLCVSSSCVTILRCLFSRQLSWNLLICTLCFILCCPFPSRDASEEIWI